MKKPIPPVYEGEEVEKSASITDLAIKHIVNEFCEKFLTAQSLPELAELCNKAKGALIETINDKTNMTDARKASEVITSVYDRMAIKIMLKTPAGADSQTEPVRA